ncbi:unnamed protein product [Boreogadus saida]
MEKQKAVLEMLAQILHIRHLLLQQGRVPGDPGSGDVWLRLCDPDALQRRFRRRLPHVYLAFGFAATLGILISGQVSAGHLNPAVTFALCLLGREPWRMFPVDFLFQMFGAFLGAKIIFGMYSDALWDYGQETLSVDGTNAMIFATYPSPHLSLLNGFFDQEIGMATLIVCILAIVEPQNTPVNPGSRWAW